MKEDDEGNNYLVYESKQPAKNVRIAEVKCRQKGLGYASSVGLEFAIATDFGKELYDYYFGSGWNNKDALATCLGGVFAWLGIHIWAMVPYKECLI